MLAVSSACDQPVTGRASLIFDRLGGTRASWRAVVIGGSAAGALEARRSRRRSLQQLPGLMQLLERGASCWQPSYALARRSPWSYRYEVRLPTAAAPARSKCSMCASQSDSCVCPHRVFRASSVRSCTARSPCFVVRLPIRWPVSFYCSRRPFGSHSHRHERALPHGHV